MQPSRSATHHYLGHRLSGASSVETKSARTTAATKLKSTNAQWPSANSGMLHPTDARMMQRLRETLLGFWLKCQARWGQKCPWHELCADRAANSISPVTQTSSIAQPQPHLREIQSETVHRIVGNETSVARIQWRTSPESDPTTDDLETCAESSLVLQAAIPRFPSLEHLDRALRRGAATNIRTQRATAMF